MGFLDQAGLTYLYQKIKGKIDDIDLTLLGKLPEIEVNKVGNLFGFQGTPEPLFIMIPQQAFSSGDGFKILAGQSIPCTLTSGEDVPDGYFQANSRVLMCYDSENNKLWMIGSKSGSSDAVSADSVKLNTPPRTPGMGTEYTGPVYMSADSSTGVVKFHNTMDNLGLEYAKEVPVDNAKKINGKNLNMTVSGTTLNITYN